MALWVCGGEGGCGTKYAVGLFRCPRCHNTAFFEDGEDPMGKISRHGGASVASEVAAAAEPVPADAAAADQPEDGLREAPGTGESMHAVDGDEVTGDGSGQALPPVPDEAYGPDAVPLESGEESEPEPASTPADAPEAESGLDYEAWTVEQLKEQLDARGLPKTGKKDDLVLRLIEDDEE